MVKKCYNCGLSDNPDSANFCGKCGKKLSLLDNWKIYNASYYCLVTKSEYDKYKQLKEKSERTFFKRIIDWFFVNRHILKGIGYSIFALASMFVMVCLFFSKIVDDWIFGLKIENNWYFGGCLLLCFCAYMAFFCLAIDSFAENS